MTATKRSKPKVTLQTYRVPLEKKYSSRSGKTEVLISGYVDVQATSPRDARAKYDELVTEGHGCLQTTDPRIIWDWEDAGWTWDELIDKQFEYVDWSFGIPEGESIELKPEDE